MSAGSPTQLSTQEWIERERARLVEEWRSASRIPSVSAEADSRTEEMARWVHERAATVLDHVESHPTPHGAPVIIGELAGLSPRRLLLYSHYDVVPTGSTDTWTADPFEADLRDGHVYARGVADDKADVVSRLHALECWTQTRGAPPWTIVWLCEGTEEIGSPGLAEVLDANREPLTADGCLWESYYNSIDGRPAIGFGSCGALDVELGVDLLDADQHTGQANVYRSATGVLIRALASLTNEHGEIAIAGFHDRVQPPDASVLAALASSPPPPIDAALPGTGALWSEDLAQLTQRWLATPSISFAGVTSREGLIVEGVAAGARATVAIRLMPDQDPDEIASLLRTHLDAHGFAEVTLSVRAAIPPARCPLDSDLSLAVQAALRDLHGPLEPVLHPVVPGSGPLHLIGGRLGVPAVMPPGTIRTDSGMHGPDEHASVEDYLDEVRLTVGILEQLAKALEA
jgi:acetylornithine deacetylase/succinyl-diaminopimelate desuccinylase-like protein